jgi:hypothetical protein
MKGKEPDPERRLIASAGGRPALTRLRIQADADFDVLLRIAATLNALNSAPLEVHLRRSAQDTVLVDVVLENCPTLAIEMVCRKLRQLTCVLAAETLGA